MMRSCSSLVPWRVLFGALAALSLLAGCNNTPLQNVTAPDFNHLEPLVLNVISFTTESLHKDRTTYPHIEGRSPYPLQEIVRRWLDETVQSAGSEGMVHVQIVNASLIEEKLAKGPGLSSLFRIGQTEKYRGHIELLFAVRYAGYTGEIVVASHASRTADENTTLRERQQIWVDLGVTMLNEIDQKLRESISENIPRLLLAR